MRFHFFGVIISAAFWLVASSVQASVIATDDFETDTPGTNNLQGKTGGIGWAAGWLAPASASVEADVVDATANPLTFTNVGGANLNGGTRAGQGWSLVNGTTGNNPVAARQLSTPLTNTFFVRYLLQYKNTNSPPQNNFGNSDTFSLHLSDTAADTSSMNFGIRSSGGTASFMVRNGTGMPVAGAASNSPVVVGATHLLVARLTYASGAFNKIDMWVDPAHGDSNSTPTATLSSASVASISYVFFRSAANEADDRYLFDNLLLGTTWDDVVPPGTTPVSVTITNPVNAAIFTAPTNILISATVSDTNGSVTNVEFFAGAVLLGETTGAPFNFLWTNVAAGNYALTAQAMDNNGAAGISPAINISVQNIVSNPVTVEKWHPADLSFTSPSNYSNPFQNVSVSATFSGPSNLTLTVPGFYAGANTWKVRFSPTAVGNWSYTTTSTDTNLNGQTGIVTCVSNSNAAVHGALKIDSSHSHYFIYEDGTSCFLMSFEADWLAEMDFGDTNVTKAKSLVNIYGSNGFNCVMMNVYGYDTTWKAGNTSTNDFGPPAQIPWLGSNSSPDNSQMNTAYFDNFDRVIDYLFQNGITAHIFFKVNNKGVNWPVEGSTNENLYFTYVTARYQAYPNIVWDFEKEGKNESGGNTYVNNSIVTIKNADAYHRLMTVHDDLSYYGAFPNTCDFQTIQADGTPLYSTLIGDLNARNWPVFESEYDYQIGNDGGKTYTDTETQAQTLQDTLECLMAGCGANYYYTYHAWDVVKYFETPNGLSAYDNLVNFFKGTAWISLAPNDGLINSAGVGRHCLALPGSEYVVYLSGAGSATLNISGAPAGNSLAAVWLDPVTGASQPLTNTGNGSMTFTNPWSDPALLHLAIAPAVPAGLTAAPGDAQVILNWTASSGATSYKVKRSTVSGTNYNVVVTNSSLAFTNIGLANGTLYYFVVSGLNATGESSNSVEVAARPVSGAATAINASVNAGQLQLNWPQDHTGWTLQMQTNPPGGGLGTNWMRVSSSSATNLMNLPVNAINGSTFFRLIYP